MRQGAIREIQWTKPAEGAMAEAQKQAPTDEVLRAIARVGFPSCPWARTPREEAVCLLRAAAEIEHALLVQYLYAAYSLSTDHFRGKKIPANAAELVLGKVGGAPGWLRTVVGIAKEEMGHLITVQNLLLLIRGRPHLDREEYPLHTDLYPFPLRLEPLTKESLAKYVTAEMPLIDYPTWELEEIIRTSTSAAAVPVNHVGVLYARIHFLFQKTDERAGGWQFEGSRYFPSSHLSDSDFVDPSELTDVLAVPSEWRLSDTSSIHVRETKTRDDALKAIEEIAAQGEGIQEKPPVPPSHYERFLGIYREFVRYAGPVSWIPAKDIATNPCADADCDGDDEDVHDQITNESTLTVARLCNVRYQMLLLDIWHALHLKRSAANDSLATRQDLAHWAIDTEMLTGVKELAKQLTLLPLGDADGRGMPQFAASPFELPDDPFPAKEEARWSRHRQLIERSAELFAEIRENFPGNEAILRIVMTLENADKKAIEKLPPP
jgi:hypothetical protein